MKKIKVLEGRSGRTWPVLLRVVKNSRKNGRRVILYVPEQTTLQTERNLILDLRLKGLLDTDVISPKKLRMLVKEKAGGSSRGSLNEYGQIMAVHRAMKETAEEMEFYRNMAGMPGAVERIREALSELRESGITPEETAKYAGHAATGAVQAKLRDLSRIRNAYESLAAENFDDEKASWTDTVERLGQTDLLRGAPLVVYGFDTVRPDLRELLCKVLETAEDVWVILTADTPDAPDGQIFGEQNKSLLQLQEAIQAAGGSILTGKILRPRDDWGDMMRWMDEALFSDDLPAFPGTPGDEITLYAASNRTDEAEQITACLIDWHEKGIPWDRMAVALPSDSPLDGVLRSQLQLSGIPYYAAENIPAVSHGVCRMLTASLECISEGYTAELAADAAMSGFSTLTEEEALALTNYAEAHGIEGSRWRQPFTQGDDAAEAERIRLKWIAPLEKLREDLKTAQSATSSVEAVVHFLETEGVWERLKEREEALLREGLYSQAVTDGRIWKLLTELLDQLWTLLGKRRCTISELKNMIESALESAVLSTLPETESGVMLGETGHMQAGEVDALVVPGCQEGILTAPESGWLSDSERGDLQRSTGREIGITRERRGWIRKYDYYRTLTAPGRFLRISWSLQDENGNPLQADALISRLETVFPGLRPAGGVQGTKAEFVPRTSLKAMESIGALLEEKPEKRETEEAGKAVISLLHSRGCGRTARRMLEEARGDEKDSAIKPETAEKLFRTDTVSISRLERYASCPYRHFIDYGLRPVRQEVFDFGSDEAGDFFHNALDRFMKTAGRQDSWPNLSEEQVDGMMDTICSELTEEWEGTPLREDALGVWQGEDYLRQVHHAARVLTRFAANSDFRTIATEQSFGKSSGLPPITLKLADGSEVTVEGTIDRIDTYENGEGVWLRVIDNKSSKKKPEPAKMEDGEQLQLMIYLKAATEAYEKARPAGALFFPVRDAEISAEETPEALEAERMKQARMKGLVNAREDVVRAMDRDLKPYSVDEVFNKDGSVKAKASWAVEEDVLRGLMDAAETKAAEICGEIRKGRIDVSPRGKSEEDAPCRFCGWRTLCRRRRDSLTPRNEETDYRKLAGKNTLREEEK